MKHWPRLHDTYIARMVVGSVLLTWAVLIGLDVVLALAGEMSEVGKGSYTINHAIVAMGLTIPERAYRLFPTAAVIGALMGLGQMAAASELTALRAIGLSRRRIGMSVALSLLVLTGLMVVNGETLAPWAKERSQTLRSARYSDTVVEQYSGLWAREGGMFLNARSGEPKQRGDERWLELRNVRLFEFKDDGQLRSIATAEVAEHRPGGWLLHKVDRLHFNAKSVTRSHAEVEKWASQLDESALAAGISKPSTMGSTALRDGIEYRHRNGLDASDFEEVYWGRWFYPFNVLVLCLAAIPFAFGSLRSGGYGKRLFIGIVFALGFWLLQTFAIKSAQAFRIDFRFAYGLPLLIMLAISLSIFRRRSG